MGKIGQFRRAFNQSYRTRWGKWLFKENFCKPLPSWNSTMNLAVARDGYTTERLLKEKFD
jgi:hypothetical protein